MSLPLVLGLALGAELWIAAAPGRAVAAGRPEAGVLAVGVSSSSLSSSPFSCATPSIFLAQRNPTQLFSSRIGAGATKFVPVGTTHGWSYNAMGFDPADKFLYAVSLLGTTKFPTGHLLRINSTGAVSDLGALAGDAFIRKNGAIEGAFDGSGKYWVTSPKNPVVDEVSVGTSPKVLKRVTLAPAGAWTADDFTFDGGFMWGMAPSGTSVVLQRLDLSTGHVSSFGAPSGVAFSSSFGAAWSFGNGNLGFDSNSTGELYQVAVKNPSSSSPRFTLVSSSGGPIAGQNDDGAACLPAAVDLSLADLTSPTVGTASRATWSLTVKNHGPGISSGYVVDDSLPSAVSAVSSSSPGCKVSGRAVTCSEGELAVGASAKFTVTALAPATVNVCLTDSAKVIGNESDPVPGNNTGHATTCTVPAWHLAEPPNPTMALGSLFGEDCTGPGECVAVGGALATSGPGITLVERLAGSTWTVQPSPIPAAGLALAQLQSVSCTSTSFCMAVGRQEQASTTDQTTLAESWNGSSWRVVPTPSDGGAIFSELNGVSCSAPTACEAVGQSIASETSTDTPLVEAWNGTVWAAQAVTLPSGSALSGVSCISRSSCTAVGESSTGAVAAGFNGSAWSRETVPVPKGTTFSGLRGVSCPTGGSRVCEASGFYDDSASTGLSLAEIWNGTAWSVQATPNPKGTTFAQLNGISCSAAASCTAVGDWVNAGGDDVTLAERWNGAAWALQSTPNPVLNQSDLQAVSCPVAGSCSAVGLFAVPNQQTDVQGGPVNFFDTLAEVWNGTSWSRQTSIDPVGAGVAAVYGLSCASATFCLAAMTASSPAGPTGAVEQWNGTRWTMRSVTDNLDFFPGAVSCSSSSDCVAAGTETSGTGTTQPGAEAWNGSSWSVMPAPPGDSFTPVEAIDCLSQVFCMATATGGTAVNPTPQADFWNGSKWTATTMPLPAGGQFAALPSISCSSTSACTAVGSVFDASSQHVPLVESWNGSTWAETVPQLPGGASVGSLEGVSCTAATSCMAVGAAGARIQDENAWATRLAAGAWSPVRVQEPGPAPQVGFAAVSCTAADACSAVGAVGAPIGAGFVGRSLAERWNGSAFSVEPTPGMPSSTGDNFTGVACVSATECLAAGDAWFPEENLTLGAIWK